MNCRGISLSFAIALAVFGAGTSASADGDDPVVLKVGTVTMTKSELERRMARVPTIQLATFGKDPTEIKRAFLQKVVVPEILLSEGAKAQHVDQRREVRSRLLDVDRGALVGSLRKQLMDPATGVSDADVATYFDEHKDKFQTPERVSVWRILVKTKADADKILEELKKPGGDKKWSELSREKSTDQATRERGGNLGFIAADGMSNEATVKVDPALFAAAKKVNNGEFVPQPVPEGDSFAVVWRRGGTPAVSRTLEQEKATIRVTLVRMRTEGAQKDLLTKLRGELVKETSYDLLTAVDVTHGADPKAARPRGPGPRPPMTAHPAPSGQR